MWKVITIQCVESNNTRMFCPRYQGGSGEEVFFSDTSGKASQWIKVWVGSGRMSKSLVSGC